MVTRNTRNDTILSNLHIQRRRATIKNKYSTQASIAFQKLLESMQEKTQTGLLFSECVLKVKDHHERTKEIRNQ